jgi:hypothetical protein
MEPILAVGVGVGVAATVVAGLVYLVRRVQKMRAEARLEMERDVLRGHTPVRLDDNVNFFGLGSKGGAQLRGNGALAVGSDVLAFVMWVPRRTIKIPLADIVEVDEVKSHAGKATSAPLLRVRWRTAGVEETAAWWVRDVAGWIETLRAHGSTR